jgi:hypothetical protein
MRSGPKRSRRRISTNAQSKTYHEEVDSDKSIESGLEGEEYMPPVLYQSTVDVALVSEQAEDGAADRRRVRQACDYCRTKKCKVCEWELRRVL